VFEDERKEEVSPTRAKVFGFSLSSCGQEGSCLLLFVYLPHHIIFFLVVRIEVRPN
jgi:hypothetical protein